MDTLAPLLSSSVSAGTVLALAALGLLINERSGVVNLGAEGMMLTGALAAYVTAFHSQSVTLGFAAGIAAGVVMAAVFGAMVIWLSTNQYATGLALSLFGSGFTAFAGSDYTGRQVPRQAAIQLGGLSDLPFFGQALFHYHIVVYLAIALCIGLGWFLYRSRPGLVLRGIGESPESAHALGYPVRRIRFAAVLFGGALCGLAGAYLALEYTPQWTEGLTAGSGWIALALTTFATWRPGRALLGAYLFGGVTILQLQLQGLGVEVDSHLLAMTPYLATILVLVLISRKPAWVRRNMPASLGKAFRPNS